MTVTRRVFGKVTLSAIPTLALFGTSALGAQSVAKSKPNSRIAGVQFGVIVPYALYGLPADAQSVLSSLVQLGISGVEMQHYVAEAYAGAPPTGPRPRGTQTPAEQEGARQAAAALTKWRLSADMEKFRALRRLYNDAGVEIYAYKFEYSLAQLSDAEVDYGFQAARTLGATHVTMELPSESVLLKRIGDAALKHKMVASYHLHTTARFDSWDQALAASPGNAINFDIGHYVAGSGQSPIPFLEKYHDRIASVHLRDQTKPSADGTPGTYVPWGEGEVPLDALLRLIRDRKYKFPVTIEYVRLEGRDTMTEIAGALRAVRRTLG
jgi:sugar phosphate isomerase/epimerase